MATDEVSFKYTADVRALVKALQSVDGVSAKSAKQMVSNLDKAARQAEAAQRKAAKAAAKEWGRANKGIAKGVGSQASDMLQSLLPIPPAFGAVAGPAAIAAGAVAGFASAIYSATQAQSELVDQLQLAQRATGLSAESVVGLRYAAGAMGVQFDQIQPSLSQFSKRMLDATRGTGEALPAFERLGVSVVDAGGSMRSMDDVLAEVTTRLAAVASGTERAGLANQLFGEQGAKVAAVYADGGRTVRDFADRARELGLVLSDDVIAQSADVDRVNAEMAQSWDALTNQLAVEFGPAVVDTTRLVSDLVAQSSKLVGWLRWAAERVRDSSLAYQVYSVTSELARDRTIQLTEATRDLGDAQSEQAMPGGALSLFTKAYIKAQQDKIDAARGWAAEQSRIDAEQQRAYDTQLAAMRQLQDATRAATLQSATEEERLTAALEDRISAIMAMVEAAGATPQAVAEANAAVEALTVAHNAKLAELAAERTEVARSTSRAEQAAPELARASWEDYYSGVSQSARAVGDLIEATAGRSESAQRRAAVTSHALSKAAGLAEVTISTAQAIMKGFASMDPISAGVNAAAVGVLGAVQAATIAATPPPRAHMGMGPQIGTSGPSAPDERLIRVRRDEAVVTPGQMRRGGRETMVVQHIYTHRALDAVVTDSVRRAKSPLRAAVRGGERAGQRRR